MRGRDATTLGLVGLVTLLVGCGVASPRVSTSVAAPSVPAGQFASPKVPLARQPEQSVSFAVVAGPNQVVVAVFSGTAGMPSAQLLTATAAGTDVRNIGPRFLGGEIPDSVFFLNSQHGWLATYSVVTGETLYRTSDGGRSWQAFPAPDHVLAASTTDAVQFTTPDVGWLADVQPTGPTETLYQTTDGGAIWQQVATLNQALPRLGVVEFEPRDGVGWLGGVPYYRGPLEFTADQGRDWQAAALPDIQQGSIVGLPAIFGATLIVPVAGCSAGTTELRIYLSPNNGAHWSLSSTAGMVPGCQQVSTAFPSQTAGWAAALDNGRVQVDRTTDGGHHWSTVAAPKLTTTYRPEILAPDPSHAWLLVTGVDGTLVYVTGNAGKTWQRIDQNLRR